MPPPLELNSMRTTFWLAGAVPFSLLLFLSDSIGKARARELKHFVKSERVSGRDKNRSSPVVYSVQRVWTSCVLKAAQFPLTQIRMFYLLKCDLKLNLF